MRAGTDGAAVSGPERKRDRDPGSRGRSRCRPAPESPSSLLGDAKVKFTELISLLESHGFKLAKEKGSIWCYTTHGNRLSILVHRKDAKDAENGKGSY